MDDCLKCKISSLVKYRKKTKQATNDLVTVYQYYIWSFTTGRFCPTSRVSGASSI